MPGTPRLIMVIEPESSTRLRYGSEGSSHGVLAGKKNGEGKSFPTVKLEGYTRNKAIYIKVSICTVDKEPHVFEILDPSGKWTSEIKENLREDYTAEFKLKIQNMKKNDICDILMERRMKKIEAVREQFVKLYKKEDSQTARKMMNSFRLRFEAFEKNKPNVSICDPLYSDIISNCKSKSDATPSVLHIHRMSHVSGSCRGEQDVILLCSKIKEDNIEVIFYETDGDQEIWRSKAKFTKADIYCQVAICFKTPEYRENTEKTVYVCLESNDQVSEPLEYTYVPEPEMNKKRKLCGYSQTDQDFRESSENSEYSENSPLSSSENQQTDSTDNETSKYMNELGLDFDMKDLGISSNSELDFSLFEDIFNPLHQPCIPEQIFNQTNFEKMSYSDLGGTLDETDNVGRFETDGTKSRMKNTMRTILPQMIHNKKENYTHCSHHKAKEFLCKIYSLLTKKDNTGNTYLHVAIENNKNVAAVLHYARLAHVDIINEKNHYQETALHLAVQQKNLNTIDILLRNGANPNLKNAEGNNCYHLVSLCNYVDALLSLNKYTRYTAEYTAFNYAGLTPLHIAVKKNSKECYHLLRNFADRNILNVMKDQKVGRSLLHYAVEFQPSFVPILLNEKNVDVNIQDKEGNTPLHIACAKENIEVVKQLLKAGADTSKKNFKQKHNKLFVQEEIRCHVADVLNLREYIDDDDYEKHETDDEERDETDDEENHKSDDAVSEEEDEYYGQKPADLTTNLEILEILKEASKNASGSVVIMEKLANLLDKNEKWKGIALYFLENIEALELNPKSPSEALLKYLQKEKPDEYIEELKNVFELNSLKEELEVINEA